MVLRRQNAAAAVADDGKHVCAVLCDRLLQRTCALLLQLMLTFERRKSARWAATAIGFSALLLLLTLLFDTGRLSGVPCRLLWAVNVLSAAGTAEEILYGARGRRSSVTKASIMRWSRLMRSSMNSFVSLRASSSS